MSARRAQQAGKEFEDAVDARLVALEQMHVVAHWKPNYPRKVGNIFAEPTGADRDGVTEQGRPFAIEVKSCRPGDHFERRRVTPRQARQLDAVARVGGIALLAIEFRDATLRHRFYLVPWLEAPWWVPVSQQVLRADDLERWRADTSLLSFTATLAALLTAR